jgi:hypothetical protein
VSIVTDATVLDQVARRDLEENAASAFVFKNYQSVIQGGASPA